MSHPTKRTLRICEDNPRGGASKLGWYRIIRTPHRAEEAPTNVLLLYGRAHLFHCITLSLCVLHWGLCVVPALVLAGENLKEIVNSTHSLKSIRGICLKLNWHWKWVLERRDLLSVGAAGAFSLPRNWPYFVEWVRGKEYGLNVVSINIYLIMCLVMCKYLLPEA